MASDKLFSRERAWADPELHGVGELHEARIAAVLDALRQAGARSVVDLGCGAGALLQHLVDDPRFERISGFDISTDAIYQARAHGRFADALRAGRMVLDVASFTSPDVARMPHDAAVLLETIEHVDPRQLSVVERNLFKLMRPSVLILSTPNIEYNPCYGLAVGEFRHPDHRFEWSRGKFRQWAQGVADRNDYTVKIRGIGAEDEHHGAPTQMAVFSHAGADAARA